MNRRRPSGQVIIGKRRARLAVVGRVLLMVVGMSAVVGGGGFGMWRGWRWLHDSRNFALRDAPVSGTRLSSPEDLIRRGGLAPGVNVIALDVSAVTSEIEKAPWVRTARVTRTLPDVVRVEVEEHEPKALVDGDSLRVVSKEGRVVKEAEAADRLDLPVLTGLDETALAEGGEASTLSLAFALVDGFQGDASPLKGRGRLEGLHVDRGSGEPVWTAFVGDAAVTVKLGVLQASETESTFPRCLALAARAWDEVERRGARPRSIDVGNRLRPEWVAVRLE